MSGDGVSVPPPLGALAFAVDDPGDHIGGGHCAAMDGESADDGRIALIDQYQAALDLLVDEASATEDGWALGRPVIFVAHNLCEVALKAVIARRSDPPRVHDLRRLWATALEIGCFAGLSSDASEWSGRFVNELGSISGDGTPGKYLDGRVDGRLLEEVWCCFDINAIQRGATYFAGLCKAETGGLQEFNTVTDEIRNGGVRLD